MTLSFRLWPRNTGICLKTSPVFTCRNSSDRKYVIALLASQNIHRVLAPSAKYVSGSNHSSQCKSDSSPLAQSQGQLLNGSHSLIPTSVATGFPSQVSVMLKLPHNPALNPTVGYSLCLRFESLIRVTYAYKSSLHAIQE